MVCLRPCRIPNITQFYGTFQDNAHIFIVMEYCASGDLLELLLAEGRAMTETRVVNMVRWETAHAPKHFPH